MSYNTRLNKQKTGACDGQESEQLISEQVINSMEVSLKADLETTEDTAVMRDMLCKQVRLVMTDFEVRIRELITEKLDRQASDIFDNALRCDKLEKLESDFDDFRKNGKESQKRIENLEVNATQLKSEVSNLKSAVEAQQMYTRRNSIRIYGIKEPELRRDAGNRIIREDTTEEALKVCRDTLGLDCLSARDIDRSHRVGFVRKDSKSPRAIIVKFTQHDVKDMVIRSRYKLAGSKVVIREDLTAERIQWLKKLKDKEVSYKAISTYDGNFTVEIGKEKHSIRSESDLVKVLALV